MIAVLFLALLLAPRQLGPAALPVPTVDPRPTIPVDCVYVPVLANVPAWMAATRVPTATLSPTATPAPQPTRVVLRPATAGELKKALLTPGALVLPVFGEYQPCCPLRVEAGVTFDGRGQVTLRGEGLILYQASGATIRGVTILDADGDGIGVNRSTGVLIDRVTVAGWGDGGIDMVRSGEGPETVIRDSLLRNGKKGMLLGHQWEEIDNKARIKLERVTFQEVDVRVPKVHRASVTMVDCRIVGWSEPLVDVQLGGRVYMLRTRLEAGPRSVRRYYTPTGGTVTEEGSVWIPYRRPRVVGEF